MKGTSNEEIVAGAIEGIKKNPLLYEMINDLIKDQEELKDLKEKLGEIIVILPSAKPKRKRRKRSPNKVKVDSVPQSNMKVTPKASPAPGDGPTDDDDEIHVAPNQLDIEGKTKAEKDAEAEIVI